MNIDNARFEAARAKATRALLDARHPDGHWEGRLSSSALSTATSLGALAFVARQSSAPHPRSRELIDAGLKWLVDNVNDDGGWGDTDLSFSNISTTTLCWAAFAMADADARYPEIVKGAEAWLAKAAGGIEPDRLAPAIIRRYGKDKTFSVPILTMCVISGRMGEGRDAWKWVKQLPFELAAFPHKFFAALRLPVVSYALPALIAIGNARHARRPTWNPLTRWLRNVVRDRTLDKLKSIQPESGGFLEASPLTSFVAMSLAAAGQVGHPVTKKCVEFLVGNAREDGSWPIDTNLATWVTTLAINALGNDPEFEFKEEEFGVVRDWLLDQQYKDVHPYTNAAPGGWAWTDLSGGVPDADDTAGALLALSRMGDMAGKCNDLLMAKVEERNVKASDDFSAALDEIDAALGNEAPGFSRSETSLGKADLELPAKNRGSFTEPVSDELRQAREEAVCEYVRNHEDEDSRKIRTGIQNGVRWLLDLQNGDGGIPTFCKGWTNLPFDRSSPDITAHAVRASEATELLHRTPGTDIKSRAQLFRKKAQEFLRDRCQNDGAWIPLWFGNQNEKNEENRTYGTAKVILAGMRELQDALRAHDVSRDYWRRFNEILAIIAEDPSKSAGSKESREDIAKKAAEVVQSAVFITPGVQWLLNNQRSDGGWGGGAKGPSSVEETAVDDDFWDGVKSEDASKAVGRGIEWLVEKIENDTWTQPAPIGFYFAKLWYYEDLYPVTFTVAALNQVSSVWKQMEFDEGLRRDLDSEAR